MAPKFRDAGATGATAVAPNFLDTLTLFLPGGQIQPQHCTKNVPMVTSLKLIALQTHSL